MFFTITDIIIHTELLVAKIKSCIPRALWGGQYFFNIARTLCNQSFNIYLRLRYVVVPRIALCPPTLVTVATSHKLSLSCDYKMAAGSHPRSLDSKMTHKALYE